MKVLMILSLKKFDYLDSGSILNWVVLCFQEGWVRVLFFDSDPTTNSDMNKSDTVCFTILGGYDSLIGCSPAFPKLAKVNIAFTWSHYPK